METAKSPASRAMVNQVKTRVAEKDRQTKTFLRIGV